MKFVAADMPEANDLTIHVMAAFAEHEAKRISERTRDALAAAKARGVVLGATGPANLKRNLEERRASADAFALRLQAVLHGLIAKGMTRRTMVAELNALKIPAAKGGQWSLGQVQRVLARIKDKSGTSGQINQYAAC